MRHDPARIYTACRYRRRRRFFRRGGPGHRPKTGAAGKNPGSDRFDQDPSAYQRCQLWGAGRVPLDPALCAARGDRPDRRQRRLRPGRMRGLHGAHRRYPPLCLPDPGRGSRGPPHHHAGRTDARRRTGPGADRFSGRRRLSMRLLHTRADDGRGGTAAQESSAVHGRNPHRRLRQPVPVRGIQSYFPGRPRRWSSNCSRTAR